MWVGLPRASGLGNLGYFGSHNDQLVTVALSNITHYIVQLAFYSYANI
jgi:hypothetical protein